jgi:hypothetical protein
MKRKAFAFLFLFIALTGNVLAADFICKTKPGVDIASVAAAINATVTESLPEPGLYLLSAAVVPAFTPVGAEYIEVPRAASIPQQVFSIVSKNTTSSTVAWYREQPAMQLVNLPAALEVSKGRGIVIADINSAIDYGHPAPAVQEMRLWISPPQVIWINRPPLIWISRPQRIWTRRRRRFWIRQRRLISTSPRRATSTRQIRRTVTVRLWRESLRQWRPKR